MLLKNNIHNVNIIQVISNLEPISIDSNESIVGAYRWIHRSINQTHDVIFISKQSRWL